MRAKKVSVTIGIPAYNEEKNIGYLINSILSQKQLSYKIDSIIVACDDGTDNTFTVVKKLAKKYPLIKIIHFKKRQGKAVALNKIYSLHDSDFLLTFDADVVLDNDNEIELMIGEILKNKRINVVGGRFIPVKNKTLMGKFSYISYVSFEDAFLKLNKGNNFYALTGGASLIRKSLSKSFHYPKGTISDQNYLYVMATKDNKYGFKLAKNTRIFIRTVATFKDWRILGARSVVADKASVAHFFGKNILREYYMPRFLYFKSLLKWFLKSPFYTLGSIFMNLFIRIFPNKTAVKSGGMWELADSSKEAIIKQ